MVLLREERGVAFILAMVTLTVLGLVVTGGFYAARQETRISMASERAGLALAVAETGAGDVLANWDGERFGSLPVGATDPVVTLAEDGTATVGVRRISEGLYLLDSRASLFAAPETSHRIAVLARLRSPSFQSVSAAVSLTSLVLEGEVAVTGTDYTPLTWAGVCGVGSAGQAGVLLPDSTGVATTGVAVLSGSPPILEVPALSAAALTSFGGVTWAELVSVADVRLTGGAFGPVAPQVDASGACQAASSLNWGDPSSPNQPCGRYFPIIHVTGDLQLGAGSVGQGILLVDGDLHLSDDTRFMGAVVVQGDLLIEGGGTLLGGTVRARSITARNASTVREGWIASSRCAITRAILNNPSLTRAEPIPARSWIDFTALAG